MSESDVPQGTEDSGSVEEGVTTPSRQLSVAEREQRRLLGLKVRKDFMCMERVDGRLLNVVEGLELHMGVFSAAEQTRLVNMVYDFQTKGRQQQLQGKPNLNIKQTGLDGWPHRYSWGWVLQDSEVQVLVFWSCMKDLGVTKQDWIKQVLLEMVNLCT